VVPRDRRKQRARGEDQRLPGSRGGGINVVRQLLGHHTIERLGDHLLVELLDLEADFVWGMRQID
jgi:hypothetical protein